MAGNTTGAISAATSFSDLVSRVRQGRYAALPSDKREKLEERDRRVSSEVLVTTGTGNEIKAEK